MTILHIGDIGGFTLSLWGFLDENVSVKGHTFLYKDNTQAFIAPDSSQFVTGGLPKWVFKLIYLAHGSRKIILHGLFDFRLIICLFFMPWLLKKCYWVIWGGDLYH